MGSAHSALIPPWQPPDSTTSYPPDVVEQILSLADSADTFLKPNSRGKALMDEFSIDENRSSIEAAMHFDRRFSQWLPKLVPKRVSEDEFWANYYSHVQAILAAMYGVDAKKRPASPPVASSAASPVVPPPTSVPGPPLVDAAVVAAAAGVAPPTRAVPPPSQQQPGPQHAQANGVHAGQHAASHGHGPKVPGTATAPPPSPPHDGARAPQPQPQPAQSPNPRADAETPSADDALADLELKPEPPLDVDVRGLGRPIRWGLIGCGNVCEVKSGPAFQRADGSKLVAAMCRNADRARDFCKRHGVPKCYTNAELLIHDPEVDAVYIATPPGTHFELAMKVCQAGKPCLVEKPMARHLEECRAMVDAFYRVNLPLYVAYYRRRHDRFIKAKQIVRRFLGQVTSVECVLTRSDHLAPTPAVPAAGRDAGWRVDAEQSGGGLFVDLGSHTLDILDFLLGPLTNVAGDAVVHPAAHPPGLQVETGVTMTFRAPGGVLGSALWDFCSPISQDRMTIRGTRATLTMSVFGTDGPKLFLPSGKSVTYRHSYPDHTHLPLIESVVLQLRGAQVPSERLSTGESAARTAAVIDAVLRKFYRSRNDHFWTRPKTWDNQR